MSTAENPGVGNPYPLTAAVFDRRSARYRNLVVGVVLVGGVAPVAALASWDWRPLLGWLLVVPLVGLFVVRDARAVARWRADVLDGWAAGALDLDSLRDGLTSIKLLPPATLAGMLDPLPTRGRLGCFPDPKPLTREALAATVRAIDGCVVRGAAAGAVGVTATAALVAGAAAFGSWWPLAGLPLTIGLGRLARRVGARPPRGWVRRVADLRGRGLDASGFVSLAARLAWGLLAAGASARWLASVEGRET